MSLKSDLAHTLSILAFAVPVLAAAGNKNPCNVECVQQQIAKALAALPTLSPDLTAADWDAQHLPRQVLLQDVLPQMFWEDYNRKSLILMAARAVVQDQTILHIQVQQ